jgi:hypothetical protein
MKTKINIGWEALVSGIIVILGVFIGLRYHAPNLTGMYTNTIFWFFNSNILGCYLLCMFCFD